MVRQKTNGDGKIGARIKRLRRARGLNVRELAVQVPISESSIVRLERGESMVGVFTMMRIAEILGVSVAELLEDEERTILAVSRDTAQEFMAFPPDRRCELLRVFEEIIYLAAGEEQPMLMLPGVAEETLEGVDEEGEEKW